VQAEVLFTSLNQQQNITAKSVKELVANVNWSVWNVKSLTPAMAMAA